MAVRKKDVWTSSDGTEHSTEVKATSFERELIIKRLLAKQKDLKNNITKEDLPALINKHFDDIVDAVYSQHLLTTGYGKKEDF